MSDSLLRQLNEVFRDTFEDDEIDVQRDTTAEDIEGWDSLNHVTLMLRIEKAFGVKFTTAQVAKLKNVGELVDLLAAKRGS
jgi:acyl carrier protein